MKRLTILLLALLLSVSGVLAQDSATDEPPPSADIMPEVQRLLIEAEHATDLANTLSSTLNLLIAFIGAISILVSIGAILAGIAANRNLQAERDKLRDQLAAANQVSEEVKTNLDLLRDQLVKSRLQSEELATLQIEVSKNVEALSKKAEATARALTLVPLAQQQISLGNLRNAQVYLKQAVELALDDPVISYFLGDIHLRLGEYDEGIVYLEKAGATNPEYPYPSASASYAYALRQKGDSTNQDTYYTQSEKIFVELKERHPKLLDISGESVYGALAGLYWRMGKRQRAIDVYEECVTITRNNSYPFNNLGILYYLSGKEDDRDKALANFRIALKKATLRKPTNPFDSWTYFDLITAEIVLNESSSRETEIENHIEELLELNPDPQGLQKFKNGLEYLATSPNPPLNIEKFRQMVDA